MLRDMTVRQLQQYARDNGMSSITRLATKESLVKAITKYLAKSNVCQWCGVDFQKHPRIAKREWDGKPECWNPWSCDRRRKFRADLTDRCGRTGKHEPILNGDGSYECRSCGTYLTSDGTQSRKAGR